MSVATLNATLQLLVIYRLGSYIFCHCTVFNFSFELFFMLRRFETFIKREREREREREKKKKKKKKKKLCS